MPYTGMASVLSFAKQKIAVHSMAFRKLTGTFIVVLVGVGFTPIAANANLIGSTLSWQYYGGGGLYNPDSGGSVTSGTFSAITGLDATFIVPGPEDVFNITTTGTSITFNFSPDTASSPFSTSVLSLAPTIFDGIAINLLSAGAFTDVTIDPATNMPDFGASDLSFTANQIQVNFAGLAFTTSTVVTLDLAGTDVEGTPEPGTGSLMALSFLILGLFFGRKTKFPR